MSMILASLGDAIERELQPAEKVLWLGQPQPRRFRGEKWGEVAFGALLCLVALGALLGLSLVVAFVGDYTVLLLLPAPLLFGWHAVNHLRAPWKYRAMLARTIYAVTNQRAIVLHGFGYSRRMNLEPGAAVQSFVPTGRGGIQIRPRRDGVADIILAGEYRGSGKYSGRYVEFGFFGIDDADHVSRLLDKRAVASNVADGQATASSA